MFSKRLRMACSRLKAPKGGQKSQLPSFAPGPADTPAGSEADHQWWTLPMAAAWFTWRSRHAVQHQSKSARLGWKRWVVVEPASNSFVPPKCRLTDFGQPDVVGCLQRSNSGSENPLLAARRADAISVFFVGSQGRPSVPSAEEGSPIRNLDCALTKEQRDRVPPAYWRANFDAHANGHRTHLVRP